MKPLDTKEKKLNKMKEIYNLEKRYNIMFGDNVENAFKKLNTKENKNNGK